MGVDGRRGDIKSKHFAEIVDGAAVGASPKVTRPTLNVTSSIMSRVGEAGAGSLPALLGDGFIGGGFLAGDFLVGDFLTGELALALVLRMLPRRVMGFTVPSDVEQMVPGAEQRRRGRRAGLARTVGVLALPTLPLLRALLLTFPASTLAALPPVRCTKTSCSF